LVLLFTISQFLNLNKYLNKRSAISLRLFFYIVSIYIFIYLLCAFVVSNALQLYHHIPLEIQVSVCSILILLIGIPHGTLDHLMVPIKNGLKSQIKFYAFYLGLILLFTAIWTISKQAGLLSFLFISAFHFGETQLYRYNIKKEVLKHLVYIVWGSAVTFSILYYNAEELINFSLAYPDTVELIDFYHNKLITYTFVGSNALLILWFAITSYNREMNAQEISKELFFIFIIHISAFLFSLLICFTLFFIVLHSVPSLVNQFEHLKSKIPGFNLTAFIKLMLPFSSLSLFFITAVLTCSYYEIIPLSIPLLTVVLISVITLPHTLIMCEFNKSKSDGQTTDHKITSSTDRSN